MALIRVGDANANWFEALSLWNRVVNWSAYGTQERELEEQLRALLILLWNERDWLRTEFPQSVRAIDDFVKQSTYIKVVADLANTAKHRMLTKKRHSSAQQTDYYGRIEIKNKGARRLFFITMDNGEHCEMMQILRGALDEYQELRRSLRQSP